MKLKAYLIGLAATVAAVILLGAATALILGIFNGQVEVPEPTRSNFWQVLNTVMLVVLIPGLTLFMQRIYANSKENTRRIEETQQLSERNHATLQNGIKTALANIERATTGHTSIRRDPDIRTRKSDIDSDPGLGDNREV